MHPFAAKMAAARAAKAKKHGKTKRKSGVKRAKKVVKAVARETAKDVKSIKKAAKKIAKKVGKSATRAGGKRLKKVKASKTQQTVAKAAKHVADQCAKELKEVRAKAEMALALGNIGRGMRSATHGGPQSKHIRSLKGRLSAAKRRASMAGTSLRAHAHPAHGKKHKKAAAHSHSVIHRADTLHYQAGKKRGKRKQHHAAEGREVSASQILGGMRQKGKKRRGTVVNFWVCAGETRTGCGHGGSYVLGDQTKHKAIRLRS